nr:hypothetical protein [Tanacetum cinerariifolium]
MNLFMRPEKDIKISFVHVLITALLKIAPIGYFLQCLKPSRSRFLECCCRCQSATSAVTTVMTAMLKQLQANPPPAQVKDVEEIVLPVEVLIRTTSVLPPVATLSQNSGIISKVTFQQPQATTIRVIPVIVLRV